MIHLIYCKFSHTRRLQTAVNSKALQENKLIELGQTLETLKKSLTDKASSSEQHKALREAVNDNQTLRTQLHQHQQELSKLKLELEYLHTPYVGGEAALQVELAQVRGKVSELQLLNDDLNHQLILANQLHKQAEEQLTSSKEEFERARMRFENEIISLRQVADDRQRRLKEREEVPFVLGTF
jgi:hypothetical protein